MDFLFTPSPAIATAVALVSVACFALVVLVALCRFMLGDYHRFARREATKKARERARRELDSEWYRMFDRPQEMTSFYIDPRATPAYSLSIDIAAATREQSRRAA